MTKEKLEELKSSLNELKTLRMTKKDNPPKFLSIETYNCHLNNGQSITRERILKGQKDGSATIIFAMTTDKKFILAIEPRVFTKETVDIGLPAGYIEEKEAPVTAAKRELLEETGYEAKEIIPLGSYYQDQGCSAALNHYFFATNCQKVKEQSLDEGEFIKYILVDYDDLMYLLNNGYIKGLNSAYAIEKAKQLLKNNNQ